MSDNRNIIYDFFKKISLKTKIFVSIIFSIIMFFLIIIFRIKISNRKMLEYELSKIRHTIEIERLKDEESINLAKINLLEKEEADILNKIKEIESIETSGNVTNEELDKFFDDRGF